MTDTITPTTVASPFAPPPDEARWVALARELAVGFAADAARYDDEGVLPIVNLTALVDSGLDTALLQADHGGGGISFRTFGELLRVITKACPSTGCIWLMHVGAASALVSLAPPEAAAFYAEEWKAGKRFANALSEPTSGNLFLVPLQAAEPVEGGWSLSGAKRFVSGCEIADHLLVNALVDGIPNFFGVGRSESISFIPIWDTMGMRATRSQLISFEDTLLPAWTRCRPPGLDDPNPIGTGLAFMSVGVAEAALDALVTHARGRVIPTTGEPLSKMQWVQYDVAEAHVALEATRLLAGRTMWMADMRDPQVLQSAIEAKLHANQVAKSIAELGVRIGGASGYLKTSPIQRHFRDAQAGALMAYSVELCRDYLGRAVLDPPTTDAADSGGGGGFG